MIAIPTDLQDERLVVSKGFSGALNRSRDRIKSGDLGNLPVIIGLVLISTIFQFLNPFFLSSANLSNLLMECTAVGVLALGIVIVLLVGEIDLSVGSMSGLSAAIFAVQFINHGRPIVLCLILSILVGMFIGWLYGQLYNKIGVPAFVITLAGLLGFLGLQLFVLGKTGTINLPFESPIVAFGQQAYVGHTTSYILAVLLGLSRFALGVLGARTRKKAELSSVSYLSLGIQSVLISASIGGIAWYLNKSRGIGWMFVFFIALVLVMDYALKRTSWGRSIFAVGGNREAARRAGINVRRVYTSAFVLCSTLGAIGGLLAAGRLAAAAQSSGTGDVNLNAIAAAVIGGTSLFGGRGSAFAAPLGMLVIASISSGLTLMNLDSAIRYMVTGAIVLIAVSVDAVARRSRTASGRG
jgi:simple sugar transport system permease protein/D-xylose transport system permease protein